MGSKRALRTDVKSFLSPFSIISLLALLSALQFSCGAKNSIAERTGASSSSDSNTLTSSRTSSPEEKRAQEKKQNLNSSSSNQQVANENAQGPQFNNQGSSEIISEMPSEDQTEVAAREILMPENLKAFAILQKESIELFRESCEKCHKRYIDLVLANTGSAVSAKLSITKGKMPRYVPNFAGSENGKKLLEFLDLLMKEQERSSGK